MTEKLYVIEKLYHDINKDAEVVKRGLTLEEAQSHCNDPATHKEGEWWHSYRPERTSDAERKKT